jgi:hypothetical protein
MALLMVLQGLSQFLTNLLYLLNGESDSLDQEGE